MHGYDDFRIPLCISTILCHTTTIHFCDFPSKFQHFTIMNILKIKIISKSQHIGALVCALDTQPFYFNQKEVNSSFSD